MNNLDILRLPDVRAALCAWWDETPGAFTRGHTSAVVADLLDDHGYVWPPPNIKSPPMGKWMRLGPGGSYCIVDPDGDGPFHEAAGIFRVSVATQVNPRIMQMVNWFGQELRVLGIAPSDMARDAVTLISPEDCGRLGRTLEFREYFRWAVSEAGQYGQYGQWVWERIPTAVHGFAPLFYGMHFKLNDVQPEGQIDCWCGDVCVTARVY